MKLTKDTVLQRAHDVSLVLEGNRVRALFNGSLRDLSSHTPLILGVFDTPKAFSRGVEELQGIVHGQLDWIRLTSQIRALTHLGLLVGPESYHPPLESEVGWFSSTEIHIRMLNDRVRTEAYQQALKQVVGPDDVVLDIGTGTGVLAASAALAGARHVFAVERSANMAKLAGLFFERNGVGDQVTVIEGDSSRIDIPEKADVLVSEIIGNDPLVEGILQTYADAGKRLLKPNA